MEFSAVNDSSAKIISFFGKGSAVLCRQGSASVTVVIKTFLLWNIWQDGINREEEGSFV